MTKEGLRKPNYWGSLTQASTTRIGNYLGEEIYVPFKSLVPMVEPEDIVLGERHIPEPGPNANSFFDFYFGPVYSLDGCFEAIHEDH